GSSRATTARPGPSKPSRRHPRAGRHPTSGTQLFPHPPAPGSARPVLRAILTDIEGTTSSISFVKDVLFPYARRALPGFVRAHGQEPDVRRWLDAVAAEHGAMCDDAMIVETLQGWIDEDRKDSALKAPQGMVGR